MWICTPDLQCVSSRQQWQQARDQAGGDFDISGRHGGEAPLQTYQRLQRMQPSQPQACTRALFRCHCTCSAL